MQLSFLLPNRGIWQQPYQDKNKTVGLTAQTEIVPLESALLDATMNL